MCLTVEYVDGHEQPPLTFVLFNGTTNESDSQSIIINGTVRCTQLPPRTSYDIIATDFDASDDINITAAVTILGVAVPDYTITPLSTMASTCTNYNTPTGTVTHHIVSRMHSTAMCISLYSNCYSTSVTGCSSSCSTCIL